MSNIFQKIGAGLQADADTKNDSEQELIDANKRHAAAVRKSLGPRSTMTEAQAWERAEQCPECIEKANALIGKAIRAEVGCTNPNNDYHGLSIDFGTFDDWNDFYFSIRDRTPRRAYDPITQKDDVETLQSLQTKFLLKRLAKVFKTSKNSEEYIFHTLTNEDQRQAYDRQGASFSIPSLKAAILGLNKILSPDNKIDPAEIDPSLASPYVSKTDFREAEISRAAAERQARTLPGPMTAEGKWAYVEKLPETRKQVEEVVAKAIRAELKCDPKKIEQCDICILIKHIRKKWELDIEDNTPRRAYDPITGKDDVETLQSLNTKIMLRRLSRVLKADKNAAHDHMTEDQRIEHNIQGGSYSAFGLKKFLESINTVLSPENQINSADINSLLPPLAQGKPR